MGFRAGYLDRLRAAVRVSEVAAKRHHLRKEGGELVASDNKSLKINDRKGVWKDWGDGTQKGGDIFAWLETYEGLTFPEAVKRVSDICGMPLEFDGDDRAGPRDHERPLRDGPRARSSSGARKEIFATWDFTGPDGSFRYQVVRYQWKNPDGSWEITEIGKARKSISQRRKSPEFDGTWVNSLTFSDQNTREPREFMRRGNGDWYPYDPDKYRERGCTERRTFQAIPGGLENVEHTLLHLPEIIDELNEERAYQRTIFIPEGEAKVDLLRSWGLLATTNSGGALNWLPSMSEILANGGDLVILEDNDDTGRKRSAKLAADLRERGARVRILSFPSIWPGCPEKGDIVDWAGAGGTREALEYAVGVLPDWTPPPYESKFGAVMWGAHRSIGEALSYQWLIKELIPAKENVLIIGPPGSGKSFEVTNMALAIARGVYYQGRKVKQGGIVYCSYEGAIGTGKRLLAYELFHNLNTNEDIPFARLTRPPGLFADEENAKELAGEILAITKNWLVRVAAIVVDTHNSATRGSSEIDSKDVSRILERYGIIRQLTGAPIWIIGHTNADGKHRGNEQIYNNIETCLLIEKVTEGYGKRSVDLKDANGDQLRRITVRKQREGEDGIKLDFVLRRVEVGRDEDGDPITSMVSTRPDGGNVSTARQQAQGQGRQLSKDERFWLDAMRDALGSHGRPPPAGLQLPRSVGQVVSWDDFCQAYQELEPPGDMPVKSWRAKRQNLGKSLKTKYLVGGRMCDGTYWLWRIKDETERRADTVQTMIDTATGGPMEGLDEWRGV